MSDRAPFSAFRVDLGDLHDRTMPGEEPRDRPADAVAPAGDDRDLAIEEPAVVGDRGDAAWGLGGHAVILQPALCW
jgi:hypothetical protein